MPVGSPSILLPGAEEEARYQSQQALLLAPQLCFGMPSRRLRNPGASASGLDEPAPAVHRASLCPRVEAPSLAPRGISPSAPAAAAPRPSLLIMRARRCMRASPLRLSAKSFLQQSPSRVRAQNRGRALSAETAELLIRDARRPAIRRARSPSLARYHRTGEYARGRAR